MCAPHIARRRRRGDGYRDVDNDNINIVYKIIVYHSYIVVGIELSRCRVLRFSTYPYLPDFFFYARTRYDVFLVSRRISCL